MKSAIEYKKASLVDVKKISNLHRVGIPTGFLSKQSSGFLEALYTYLIRYEIVYVAKEDGNIIGFIAASINTSGLYKRFLKSNLLLLIKFVLQNIFSIEFMKKAYETLNAPKKTRIKEMKVELPELLSIVVDDKYIGKGIGKYLLSYIEKDLVFLKYDKYKVIVGANLVANKFYIKNDFVVLKKLELHHGITSYIYIKNIGSNH